MIKIDINCIGSLAHLIKDQNELNKRCSELIEKDPVLHMALITIAKTMENYATKENTSIFNASVYSAFLMYNLIRIQIESNDLEENV